MIILDASVVVATIRSKEPVALPIVDAFRGVQAHAPELLDLEVTQALRRLTRRRELPPERARLALDALIDSPIERWPHAPLLEGAWALRDRLTTYDAAYLVLADLLGAPLATLDAGLASVAREIGVEVIAPG